MSTKYTYKDLLSLLNLSINENVKVNASSINSILGKLLASIRFADVVDDIAKRNLIPAENRYGGFFVYVKSDETLYTLKHDLITWGNVTLDGLTEEEITLLLNDKVDKETGKGLSQNDFTNELIDKLNSIEEKATRNSTDEVLVERSNHEGYDQIEDVENLRQELDLLWVKKRLITTSNIQLDYDYKTIFIDASFNNINVILPDTIEDNSKNTQLRFKRIDNSIFNVIILPFDHDESTSSSESVNIQLIEGFNSLSLNQGDSYLLNSVNDKWYIMAKYSI